VVVAESPYRDSLYTYTVRPWVGRRQQPKLPAISVWRFPLSCRFPREEHLFPSTEGRRLRIHSLSINPTFQVTLLLGGYSMSASVRRPLCFTSPRPTGSMLLVCLRLTSRWLVFRHPLNVWWLRLILFKSRILLAVMAPCLHFKPLHLLFRDLMFVFICAQEDFLFWIPVHSTRLHHHHVFSPLRRDFISASSPTHRSGACETWVPMGPHRSGS
jgi:hypothetical protein